VLVMAMVICETDPIVHDNTDSDGV
jgi:hypothetical protein